ncbi:hypothetical protein E4V85_09275 [Neisseria meningitidis]|nr:hypothetical protein [Neisseria meningitidis]MBG8746005.1 hypothetical protein [Neisseria meningitidis]
MRTCPHRNLSDKNSCSNPEILDSHFRGNDGSVAFRQHRNLEIRHSRAGGNPDLSAQKLIG